MCIQDSVYQRFNEGDHDAMSTLITAYQHDLYNLCYRLTFNPHDADDLFQETWLKAIRASAGYQHEAFRAWLFQICLNQYRDLYRKNKRRRALIQDDFASTSAKDYVLMSAESAESPEEQYEKKFIQGMLVANINRLPDRYKLPVVLFYYQQLKYAEIAVILNIPEGTVKSRINTAKKRLKSVLEREMHVAYRPVLE